ncbi:hypothetical protein [Pseudaestuariivita atlantica]|uniref:Uncharacterized protein n=1 Tax=Pseudaestuariivita atlantica TaxID=1317121 RepID=A0A0L1JT88_9RHOB|nr:hypothetical protein [Pseudaestuariivita atlantica]KNG94633.1 hypothetical protein ATO11_04315 [Pseudaestuariivita atlantica]
MNAFRPDALLDVVLGASAVLLIFLLVLTSGEENKGYHRQATHVVGCYTDDEIGANGDTFITYPAGKAAKVTRLAVPIASLQRMLAPGLESVAVAILTDADGLACAKKVYTSLKSVRANLGLSEIDWRVEMVPCESNQACTSLLGIGSTP